MDVIKQMKQVALDFHISEDSLNYNIEDIEHCMKGSKKALWIIDGYEKSPFSYIYEFPMVESDEDYWRAMQDNLEKISYNYCGYGKTLFFDGNTFNEIEETHAVTIYERWRCNQICRWAMNHPEVSKVTPQLKMQVIGKAYLKEQLEYAAKIGDTSLISCLHRLRRWRRLNSKQYTRISKDWYKRSFLFIEVIDEENDRYGINGGVVFHEDEDGGGHWQIHT